MYILNLYTNLKPTMLCLTNYITKLPTIFIVKSNTIWIIFTCNN